jgi:hypothetical protein
MPLLKANGVLFETDEARQIDPSLLDTNELVQYVFFQNPVGFRGSCTRSLRPKLDHRTSAIQKAGGIDFWEL